MGVKRVVRSAVPLRYESLAQTLGLINPAYWAMNSMASTADLNTLLGYSSDDEVLAWVSTVTNWTTSTGTMVGFALFLCIAVVALGSMKPSR